MKIGSCCECNYDIYKEDTFFRRNNNLYCDFCSEDYLQSYTSQYSEQDSREEHKKAINLNKKRARKHGSD